MTHQDGRFKGVGNADIYYQYWLPEEPPRGILLIIHGLAEHSGRYMNVVNHFIPSGFAVFGIDHYGHGKSEGHRVFIDKFSDFTDNIHTLFLKIKELYPEVPLVLVGHSMGGLISSVYLVEHQTDFQAAVISGPATKVPDNISGITVAIGRIFSKIMPKLGLIGLDVNDICRDPAVVEAYVNDPLTYTGKTSARLAAEMLGAMQFIAENASAINLPILIVQGGDDRLVPPAGAQFLYDQVSSKDKTLKIYDGLYHEVFNEPEHGTVLAEVATWLEKFI